MALGAAIRAEMGKHLSIDMFGARPGTEFSDGAMTATSAVFTSASAAFTAENTGDIFVVPGALGALADPLVATGTYLSATQMTLSVTATTTVSGKSGAYGPNCQAAINEAIANARKRNLGYVLIPSGLWLTTGALLSILAGVTIYGRGPASIIYSADYTNSALAADGVSRVGVFDLAFKSHALVRQTNPESVALLFRNCTDVQFDRIYVDGAASAGVFITGSSAVRGGTVWVKNTRADGVHITCGSFNVRIETVNGQDTGDDTFAVVSYAGDTSQVYDVICGFVKSLNSGARGFGIVGPTRVQVLGYQIDNPASHGFVVAYELGFLTRIPSKIKIGPGTINSANTSASFNGFFVGGLSGSVPSDIEIDGATLTDSNQVLITFASSVRISRLKKTGGNYRGMLVQDCLKVDTIECRFETLTDEALTYDRVTDGRIESCTAVECQSVGNASRGRYSILDSKRIVGKGNYDFRDTASGGASIGPVLVSNTTTPADRLTNLIEVNGHAPAAAVGSRVFGLLMDSARGLLRLNNDFEPADELLFNAVFQRGLYIIDGPMQIDSNDGYRGSGSAAELNLFSGAGSLNAEAGIIIHANRSGATPATSIEFKHGLLTSMRIPGDGHVNTLSRVNPGSTASNHGYTAITGGTPEGVIAAPVGSICIVDAGDLNATIYVKVTGTTTSAGWIAAYLVQELPGGGTNGQFLKRGSPNVWANVDVGLAASIAATGFSATRYALWDGSKFVPHGAADVFALCVAPFYNDIAAGVEPLLSLSIGDIDGLQAALDAKSDLGHSHAGEYSAVGHTH